MFDPDKEETVDPDLCIVCQKDDGQALTTKQTGRLSMKRAAKVRNDHVYKRICTLKRNASESVTVSESSSSSSSNVSLTVSECSSSNRSSNDVVKGNGCSDDCEDEIDDVMFSYHNTNRCFKTYVHSKSLEKLKKKKANSVPEPMEVVMKPDSPPRHEPISTRSSLTPREPPSSLINPVFLKCTVCGQKSKYKVYEKFKISEDDRALKLARAALFFKNKVFTTIADLISDDDSQTISRIKSADLYCHKSCYDDYIRDHLRESSESAMKSPKNNLKRTLFKRAYPKLLKMIQNKGIYVISDLLKFTLDHLEDGEHLNTEFRNRDLKHLMIEEFGESITITENPRQFESDIVYSSDITPADLAAKIKNINVYQECGINL